MACWTFRAWMPARCSRDHRLRRQRAAAPAGGAVRAHGRRARLDLRLHCGRCRAQRPPPAAPRAAELPRQRAALHPRGPHRAGRAPAGRRASNCRSGIPARAFPSTTCGRSSRNSSASSSRPTGASRAWAWVCRSASASRTCSTTRCACARGSVAAACSPSAPRVRAPVATRPQPRGWTARVAGRPARAVRRQRPRHPRRHARAARPLGRGGAARGHRRRSAGEDAGRPDVLLVDYHLHDRLDGLDTLDALRAAIRQLPGALLTADGSDALKQRARARLPGADQADQAGVAAGVPGGAKACTDECVGWAPAHRITRLAVFLPCPATRPGNFSAFPRRRT